MKQKVILFFILIFNSTIMPAVSKVKNRSKNNSSLLKKKIQISLPSIIALTAFHIPEIIRLFNMRNIKKLNNMQELSILFKKSIKNKFSYLGGFSVVALSYMYNKKNNQEKIETSEIKTKIPETEIPEIPEIPEIKKEIIPETAMPEIKTEIPKIKTEIPKITKTETKMQEIEIQKTAIPEIKTEKIPEAETKMQEIEIPEIKTETQKIEAKIPEIKIETIPETVIQEIKIPEIKTEKIPEAETKMQEIEIPAWQIKIPAWQKKIINLLYDPHRTLNANSIISKKTVRAIEKLYAENEKEFLYSALVSKYDHLREFIKTELTNTNNKWNKDITNNKKEFAALYKRYQLIYWMIMVEHEKEKFKLSETKLKKYNTNIECMNFLELHCALKILNECFEFKGFQLK